MKNEIKRPDLREPVLRIVSYNPAPPRYPDTERKGRKKKENRPAPAAASQEKLPLFNDYRFKAKDYDPL